MNKHQLQPSYIVDHLFFLIENGCILVWNYKTHEQYILEKKYFLELLHLSQTNTLEDKKIHQELLDANLISKTPVKNDNWGWDLLSKIFHVGTKNVATKAMNNSPEQYAKNYIKQCTELKNDIPHFFSELQGELINLPEPDITLIENISFYTVLKNRKTCRNFNSNLITLKELSLILFCSFGLLHGNWDELDELGLKQTGLRKASPSSGGIHSEEAYIAVYEVDNLQPGLYHYRPQDHKLTLLKIGHFEKEIIELNYDQFFSKGLSFGVYITSKLEKIWWKYKHSRSYKAMLLDIGHVSQTFLNCSTALGMQTWITGAFHDAQVENFLSIDGNKESAILFVGAGKGTNQSIPNIIMQQL